MSWSSSLHQHWIILCLLCGNLRSADSATTPVSAEPGKHPVCKAPRSSIHPFPLTHLHTLMGFLFWTLTPTISVPPPSHILHGLVNKFCFILMHANDVFPQLSTCAELSSLQSLLYPCSLIKWLPLILSHCNTRQGVHLKAASFVPYSCLQSLIFQVPCKSHCSLEVPLRSSTALCPS